VVKAVAVCLCLCADYNADFAGGKEEFEYVLNPVPLLRWGVNSWLSCSM